MTDINDGVGFYVDTVIVIRWAIRYIEIVSNKVLLIHKSYQQIY